MTTAIERPAVLSDQVVAVLERRIRSGKIAPGARLPSERELCSEFGVSRVVVREAIARLKGDGYIETRQGAGASVPAQPGFLSYRLPAGARIGQQDLSQIMELRFAVEVVATQLAALRRKDSDLAAMQSSLQSMHEAVRSGADGSRADDEFHHAIAASTQNPHLKRFVEFLRYQFGATRRATWNARAHKNGETQRAQLQHEQILALIRNRDVEGAGRVAADHLVASAARIGLRGAVRLPRVAVQGIDDHPLFALP
jgi:GntR family transcriptional regulator, transcriptional repressor for pyruvate dehydrogenase complex